MNKSRNLLRLNRFILTSNLCCDFALWGKNIIKFASITLVHKIISEFSVSLKTWEKSWRQGKKLLSATSINQNEHCYCITKAWTTQTHPKLIDESFSTILALQIFLCSRVTVRRYQKQKDQQRNVLPNSTLASKIGKIKII